ncbi:MAG: U32 family peptidase [Lachnospiraceae bacterium]|nr:U32 family peptidase [Lachnospiraceae bacterium]
MRHPELLLPAGSLPVLKTAVLYGADAVYIGGETFSLRAKAKNFTQEEMRQGIDFAHEHGARVYVTANIFAHEADLADARRYFEEMKTMRPDALLVADPGMFSLARKICPEIPLHISTQANTTNAESMTFWHDLGATRIVTARELSLQEIRQIREEIPPDLEIECFVHGAMCISYSGRCLLSNYFTGRDANRGACTHPCRWKYAVVEETRPGEYMPIVENERGTYVFNSRDLSMIDHLPDLYDAGIDSFKVEGRMKTALYVATAARTYSMAMRDYEKDPSLYAAHLDHYREQISEGTYRRFTTGFFYGKPGADALVYDSNTYLHTYTFLGLSEGMDAREYCLLHQKNKFSVGETIEIMKPDGRNIAVEVRGIYDADGISRPSAPHPGQELHVDLGGEEVLPFDVLRRKEETENR